MSNSCRNNEGVLSPTSPGFNKPLIPNELTSTSTTTSKTPLTVEEIKAHPEFQHVFWNLKATKAGESFVALARNGPLHISWELHGHGPRKLIWIMGLGAPKEAWQRQTRDFAHFHPDVYTCLIIDNRGVGDSSKPLMRYSTYEMAFDIMEIISDLKWNINSPERSLHLIGVSMGGMIAQELCMMIPDMIASVCFVSTAARLVNSVGWVENVKGRVNLLLPKKIDAQVEHVKEVNYSKEWLDREDETEAVVKPFPTNGDRAAASEIRKREDLEKVSRVGFICQAVAAGWHHKSPEQLKEMGDKVERERICVMHGTGDRMIKFFHGETLLEELGGENGGVSKYFPEGVGHVIPVEKRRDFFEIVQGMCEKAEQLNDRNGVKRPKGLVPDGHVLSPPPSYSRSNSYTSPKKQRSATEVLDTKDKESNGQDVKVSDGEEERKKNGAPTDEKGREKEGNMIPEVSA